MPMRTTLPLFPTDEGWPYPDADGAAEAELLRQGYTADPDVDLDALQLVANVHAFDGLSEREREALDRRFWKSESMKDLARNLGCTHAEASTLLGQAVDKMRTRLAPDG
ncbi:MAG TPA: sigma factor-like helix-turn-helix DNA-binding protein [Acidimicrobiia bacterium]